MYVPIHGGIRRQEAPSISFMGIRLQSDAASFDREE